MAAASAEAMEGGGPCGSELSPEEERLVIRDITIVAEGQCKEGDIFYLLNQRWWQHWLDYVNQDTTSISNNGSTLHGSHGHETSNSSGRKRPSFIDNRDLIYEVTSEASNTGTEIHGTLLEGRDYILLPEEAWKQLHGWYGGGPILSRKAISSGISQSELAIEVYPLRLQLIVEPKGAHAVIRMSKKETVAELHRRACEMFDLMMEQVSIWDYYGHQKHALMDNMEKTLDDSNIQMDQEILVEVQHDSNPATLEGTLSSVQENGSMERNSAYSHADPSRSTLSNAGGLSSSSNKIVYRCSNSELTQGQNVSTTSSDMDNIPANNNVSTRGASVGLTGLLNLGNTCFMNSAIQCLVHTPEFARYFREDYRKEINWQNPLGMVGELALAFGELLRKLWAPGRTPVSPRPFKTKLARFAPQFSGYNQHDSQELLAFLLDGLHEDLNRVKQKPYIKTKDADGRPDEEVADDYWQNHIARNDSIIVDVCQGQYKSTLVCPVCGKVSVTFDPFMYLSLPLQFATARMMTVTVFTSDGSALPAPYTMSVPKHGRCKDLIQALSNVCSQKPGEKLIVAEIRGHLIHRLLEDPLILLSTIKDDDHLAAYKIPNLGKNSSLFQLVQRCEDREVSNSKSTLAWKLYGIPIVTQVSRDGTLTGGEIHAMVQKMLSPMLQTESVQSLRMMRKTMDAGASISHDANTNETESEPSIKILEQDHSGPESVAVPRVALQLVDENNECIDIFPDNQSVKLNLSANSVIYLNWSTQDFDRYNTRYFENLPEVLKYAQVPKKARNEPLSLYSCMEAFLREEPLVPEDMWYCPQCKEQRQASKKLDLWRLPEVLVIHLKRFSYSRSNKHKLETFVDFPIHDFDLTNYVAHKNDSQQQLYELYALSNHYGNMASGHYTAHIKLLDENRWYNFDDSHISPINEEDVKSAAAYVLFYRRVRGEGAFVNYGTQFHADSSNRR